MLRTRNFLSLLVATCFALIACQQQPPAEDEGTMTTTAVDPAAEEAAIEALYEQWHAAFESRDPAALGALYAEDAIWIADDEPNTVGRAAIQESWAGLFEQIPDLAIDIRPEDVIVASSGDLAVSHGTYTLSGTSDGAAWSDDLKLVAFYRKIDGEWKYSGVIWNSAGPDPTEAAEQTTP